MIDRTTLPKIVMGRLSVCSLVKNGAGNTEGLKPCTINTFFTFEQLFAGGFSAFDWNNDNVAIMQDEIFLNEDNGTFFDARRNAVTLYLHGKMYFTHCACSGEISV